MLTSNNTTTSHSTSVVSNSQCVYQDQCPPCGGCGILCEKGHWREKRDKERRIFSSNSNNISASL